LALVFLDCHFSIIYDRIKPIPAVVIFVYRHLGLEWFNIKCVWLLKWSPEMSLNKINLNEKLSKFSKYWSPRIIAEMNDYQFKLVKIKGEFIWHEHKDTDEVFIVIEGNMSIEFRDGIVDLSEGEMYVVPKGVTHKTYAENECKVMLVEPTGVINTGEAGGDLTAPNDVWI